MLQKYSQSGQNSKSKHKRCQRSLEQGNREQFRLRSCNVDTLTKEKFNDLKALLSQAENLHRVFASTEVKPKF